MREAMRRAPQPERKKPEEIEELSADELQDLSPEEEAADLRASIEALGDVRLSDGGKVPAKDVIGFLDKYLKGEIAANLLPRAEGIRDKAMEIKKRMEERGEELSDEDIEIVDEGEPTVKSFAIESRVSPDHPDRNEDAALGDVIRLKEDLSSPPKMETSDPVGDAEAVRQAAEREVKVADKLKKKKVFGVLDGVSGGKTGGGTGVVASRLASARISERMAELADDLSGEDVEEVKDWMKKTFEQANADIAEYRKAGLAKGRDEAELGQMATTVSMVKLLENPDGSTEAVIGSLGDSRVYVLDGETKKLKPLTVDENIVGLMLRRGAISREDYDTIMAAEKPEELPDRLKNVGAPFKMDIRRARNTIYNALSGKAEISVGDNGNIFSVRLKKGDKLLLTSDGVHDNLTDAQLEAGLAAGRSIEEITREAYEKQRKPDDVTATMIEIGGGTPSPEWTRAQQEQARQVREQQLRRNAEHGLREAYGSAPQRTEELPDQPPPSPPPPKQSGFFKKLGKWFGGK